jgi:hypothetical protein
MTISRVSNWARSLLTFLDPLIVRSKAWASLFGIKGRTTEEARSKGGVDDLKASLTDLHAVAVPTLNLRPTPFTPHQVEGGELLRASVRYAQPPRTLFSVASLAAPTLVLCVPVVQPGWMEAASEAGPAAMEAGGAAGPEDIMVVMPSESESIGRTATESSASLSSVTGPSYNYYYPTSPRIPQDASVRFPVGRSPLGHE